MTDHDAIAARVRQDKRAGTLFSGPVYIKLADMADAYLDLYDEVKRLRAERDRLRAALESIAKNTCCEGCQEAALVARQALKGLTND